MSRKSGKSRYVDGYIICACGNRISTDLEEELTDEAKDTGESMEDSEEFECDDCGRTFKLTVGVTCIIETDFVDLEEQEPKITTATGEIMLLEEMPLGTQIDVEDGEYEAGRWRYVVRDGKLDSVWNTSISDEQVKLAI